MGYEFHCDTQHLAIIYRAIIFPVVPGAAPLPTI